MIITSADWLPFRIPFRHPFATAHGILRERQGAILRLMTADGQVGLGEASAVPGFGGSHADVIAALRDTAPQLIGRDLIDLVTTVGARAAGSSAAAAVAFAVDLAILDLWAQGEGVPLTRLLGGDPYRPVPVNATVGAPTTVGAIRAAQDAVVEGFRCVKLKVGMAATEAAEIERIRAVRAAIGPSIGLRIDANGAWVPDVATRILRATESAALEYVEQPVAAADLAGMARVRAMTSTPIAADEAVSGLESAQRVIAAGAADLLVVKPMLIGGLRPARVLADQAREAGLGVVVTTTLDTGIGIAAALHLAAALPDPLLACGLATAPLLAEDWTTPLQIDIGCMKVPDRPGLGVELRQRAEADD